MKHKIFKQYEKNPNKFDRENVSMDFLLGKTFISVFKTDDSLVLVEENGDFIWMAHIQSCCENVYLDEVVGDLSDLVGSPILKSEETISVKERLDQTWSFYKLATIKGYVDLRWVGSSNGCYSETIGIYFVQKVKFVQTW